MWLKAQLMGVKENDEEGYLELKRQWHLTPAVSDLFQAGKTVLEMHARPNKEMKKSWLASPRELSRKCASRTPVGVVLTMSPADAEAWVVDKLGLAKFAGRLIENGVSGEQLVKFPELSLKQQNSLIKVRRE